MKKNFGLMTALMLLLLIAACKNAPEIQTGSLPRSVPEAEGVSTEAILTFLDSAAASRHEFHSIMILRHGKVIAEGWWAPYSADRKHTLYSTSKSFTSTAIGFAVAEKLLTVDDKVISFFPDDLPDTISPYLAELSVKDLLTMSVGQDPDPTFTLRSGIQNWAKAFLATPVLNDPGTVFLYNSMATYMLSAIVQKVTGEKVIDYLTPRLFEPLGIQGMDWEVDPMGINTGGWGLRVKTEDMAKFGQLYLQKGTWNGNEILPAAWIEDATSAMIMQFPQSRQSLKDSSDWLQGYGYQFWRSRHNAFRADGAYGQFIIVIPEKDAVVAITAESPDMQSEINLVWDYLLPGMKDEALPENPGMVEKLKERLASLKLTATEVDAALAEKSAFSGKTFQLEPNDLNWKSIGFDFSDALCTMTLNADSTEYKINLGAGEWTIGGTTKPGPSLTGNLAGIDSYEIAASYSMPDENTLELMLRYIESPHHEKITCRISGDGIVIHVAHSLAFGSATREITGRMQKSQ